MSVEHTMLLIGSQSAKPNLVEPLLSRNKCGQWNQIPHTVPYYVQVGHRHQHFPTLHKPAPQSFRIAHQRVCYRVRVYLWNNGNQNCHTCPTYESIFFAKAAYTRHNYPQRCKVYLPAHTQYGSIYSLLFCKPLYATEDLTDFVPIRN